MVATSHSFLMKRPAADASLHVSNPCPPEVVYGCSIDEVRRRHDARAADAITTLKNGKTRAIRKDQNTLLTVVASHPATMTDVETIPSVASVVREWERLTVAWLRDQYGDQLLSVVRHVDEAHPHLHAFIIPDDPEMRAGRLHPGREAKAAVVAAGAVGEEDGQALNRRADVAYRSAMRAWQDSYWEAVGLPSGLTRLGPARRRLTRAEWQAEQTQAKAVTKAQERVNALKEAGADFAARTRARAAEELSRARREAAHVERAAAATAEQARMSRYAADASLRRARKVLRKAASEAERTLAGARREAERLQSLAGRIRAFLDGLRKSSIEHRVRRSFEAALMRAERRAAEANRRAAAEARQRCAAEEARHRAEVAAAAAGRERDIARRRLAAFMLLAHRGERLGPQPGVRR